MSKETYHTHVFLQWRPYVLILSTNYHLTLVV